MATTTLPGLLATGIHSARPAASAVGSGGLYSCTDHGLVYQTDGSSWTTWATLGGAVADILDLPTAEMDDTLVLAPDGAGGVEFRAGGGGGLAASTVGYNTVGGTAVAATTNVQIMKSVTLAAASVVLSIGVYMKTNVDGASNLAVALLADSGGAPADILAIGGTNVQNHMVQESSNAHSGPAQWVHVPVGIYVPSGTYWLAWATWNTQVDFYYDGSGSDVTATSTTTFMFDGRRYTNTTTTRKYSARAHILS